MRKTGADNKTAGTADIWALEEMPLKLMIISIVLAICIPLVVDALGEFSEDQVELNVRRELDKLITAVKLSYSSGVGTSIPVTLSIQNGVMCSIDYIQVGDELNATYESIVRFKLSDRPRSFVPVDPYIPMTCTAGGEDGPLVLGAGSYTLYAVHEQMGGKDVVNIVKG